MPGLPACGKHLPHDDGVTTTGGTGGEPALDDEERVEHLYRALLELAERPGRRASNAVTALFRTGAPSGLVRAVGARLRDEPPSDHGALYGELRRLLLTTRSSEELKFAIEIVGIYECADDADVFRVLARHDEFTLCAARALAYGAHDWVGECLALLPDLSNWGATELSGVLLHTEDERVYSVLLRHSVAVGHALDLAVGWLCEWVELGDVDDDLRRQARRILDGLTWSFSESQALSDHPDASTAAEQFLELLTDRASTLEELITAYELGFVLDSADDVQGERIRHLSRSIVARPEWHALAIEALESDDRDERALGIEAAQRLGIPLGDHLVRSLRTDPDDAWLWYHFVPGADGRPG